MGEIAGRCRVRWDRGGFADTLLESDFCQKQAIHVIEIVQPQPRITPLSYVTSPENLSDPPMTKLAISCLQELSSYPVKLQARATINRIYLIPST
jgi:hypothetical protein